MVVIFLKFSTDHFFGIFGVSNNDTQRIHSVAQCGFHFKGLEWNRPDIAAMHMTKINEPLLGFFSWIGSFHGDTFPSVLVGRKRYGIEKVSAKVYDKILRLGRLAFTDIPHRRPSLRPGTGGRSQPGIGDFLARMRQGPGCPRT